MMDFTTLDAVTPEQVADCDDTRPFTWRPRRPAPARQARSHGGALMSRDLDRWMDNVLPTAELPRARNGF